MPNWKPLDDLFSRSIDKGHLAGAVVVAWHNSGEAHRAALGLADVARGRAMVENSIFRLYSMTKPITAAAMMILWDEGKWSPEDALDLHLPELACLRVMDQSGEVRPASRSATIEELMTQRSGFAYGLTPEPVDDAFRAAGVPSFPRSLSPPSYLSRIASAPLAHDPGDAWRYGAGMDVQGLLIERLSGMTFGAFLQERIFDPLCMTDTGFQLRMEDRHRLSSLYMPGGDGIVEVTMPQVSPDFTETPMMASGGAGLLSTADDYARFGRMLLDGGALEGRRVLSERAVDMMTRSHTPSEFLDRGLGTSPHFLRPGYEYAYNGLAVTDPERAGVELGQGTYLWDGAAGTWFWVDPANDVVLVCMVQLLAPADHLSLQFQSRAIVAGIVHSILQGADA